MRSRTSIRLLAAGLLLSLISGCGDNTSAIEKIRALGCTVTESGSEVTVTCEKADLSNEELSKLTDDAKSFPKLVLSLKGTQVTGDGLKHLAALTNLTDLDLTGLTLTDDSIANLSGLAALVQLKLTSTGISDAALEHFGGLQSLERLFLDNNKGIVGSGLVHVVKLSKLRDLRLNHTSVNDEGILHLEGLTTLEKLWLKGVDTVNQEAIEELKASFVDLDVRQ